MEFSPECATGILPLSMHLPHTNVSNLFTSSNSVSYRAEGFLRRREVLLTALIRKVPFSLYENNAKINK